MSKFLKIVVNICIACFVLVGIALVVPQIAGITTVIVDDSVVEGNVSLGSVVYGKKVDLTDLGVGDKLLRSTNTSCYVSEITKADAQSGSYTVDGSDGAEDITLRSTAEKAYFVIPVIGYASIAMQSFEGRIILGLILAFLVILFILSEIWKKSGDEEEEEEEFEENEDAAASEVSEKKDNSNREDAATEEKADAEKTLTEEDSEHNETEEETDKQTGPAELILENVPEEAEAATQNETVISNEELKALEAAIGGAETLNAEEADEDKEAASGEQEEESGEATAASETEQEAVVSDGDQEDTEPKEKSEADEEMLEEAEGEDAPESTDVRESADTPERAETAEETEENTAEVKNAEVEQVAAAAEEPSVDEEKTEDEIKEEENKEDLSVEVDSFEDAIIQAGEAAEAAQAEAMQETDAKAPVIFEPLPSEHAENENDEEAGEAKGLAMPALTAEELLEKAKAAGDEPKVIEKPDLGITLIDYSDIL